MEAFSFIKFWKPFVKFHREDKPSEPISRLRKPVLDSDEEKELDEGDDSFFELELSLSDFSNKENTNGDDESETASFGVSPTDHFAKNKVIPVEIGPKPQSPVALLKSGSKFRALSFKMSKSMEKQGTEKSTAESLDVRLRIDGANKPLTLSFRKTASNLKLQSTDDTLFEDSSSSSSKRFFNLIKPLYAKGSTKQSNKERTNSLASPGSSTASIRCNEKQRNIPAGIKAVHKHLGKSRSASAAVGAASPASRVDESLLVRQDGIQSAILHCKRSFHGSRESCLLSRSSSDSSSQQKLITACSEDCYEFSRIKSDST